MFGKISWGEVIATALITVLIGVAVSMAMTEVTYAVGADGKIDHNSILSATKLRFGLGKKK